jgi:hypothetical protein
MRNSVVCAIPWYPCIAVSAILHICKYPHVSMYPCGARVQTCIEMDSRSAPAHNKLPAVEDGPHLGGDAIRAIKEQLQADRQHVRHSLCLWAATPHMDMGRVGDDRRRALVSCSGTACTFVGVESDLRKKRAPFVCPKHMQSSRRNPTILFTG